MRRAVLFVGAVLLVFSSKAQDTLTVVHYNLLNHGNYTSFCTVNNNNVADKEVWLGTIMDYIKPDLFTANEVGYAPFGIQVLNIKNNSLNINGVTKYEYVNPTNNNNSDIINGVWYNTEKLGFINQHVINHSLRDINLVKFYYKSPELALGADTVYLNAIVVHYKAGSTANDEVIRQAQANAIMIYIAGFPKEENYILGGDLNIQSSNAQSYQILVNNANQQIRFFDPIGLPGTWNNNGLYAGIHTQSTSVVSGCKASGGMDDRFDFILANRFVMNDSAGIKYVPGSYKAIGQDGLRLDQPLTSPPNNSAPPNVITALANNSDHLPVVVKLAVTQPLALSISPEAARPVKFNTFFDEGGGLTMIFGDFNTKQAEVQLFELNGKILHRELVEISSERTVKKLGYPFADGAYIIKVSGYPLSRLVIKN